MQQLNQDIQNNTFKQVYLLFGEEAYLRLQYKNRLRGALLPDDDTMNYSYFEGKDTNIAEVIDLAETMPFFADRRVIFLENTDFVKSNNDKLAEYIAGELPESVVIVLIEANVDKRTKLFKAISKAGRCVEFQIQNDITLKKWIAGKMKSENKRISERTVDIFLETVGTDMLNISTELEKLFAYTYGRDIINEDDIKAVCSVILSNRVFDMIAQMGLKNQTKALEMYQDLLNMKESPFGILALIHRQFITMLQIADLKKNGMTKPVIASTMGMSPYIVGKYLPQIDCFTIDEMKKVIEGCARVDYDVKSGNIRAELGVELLIIESSQKTGKGRR